jgi:hypothetical protein
MLAFATPLPTHRRLCTANPDLSLRSSGRLSLTSASPWPGRRKSSAGRTAFSVERPRAGFGNSRQGPARTRRHCRSAVRTKNRKQAGNAAIPADRLHRRELSRPGSDEYKKAVQGLAFKHAEIPRWQQEHSLNEAAPPKNRRTCSHKSASTPIEAIGPT